MKKSMPLLLQGFEKGEFEFSEMRCFCDPSVMPIPLPMEFNLLKRDPTTVH